MKRVWGLALLGLPVLYLLWAPTSEHPQQGSKVWEITRYGMFNYYTTEKSLFEYGFWSVKPGFSHEFDWPKPREHFSPVRFGLTIVATVAFLAFLGGLAVWTGNRGPGTAGKPAAI